MVCLISRVRGLPESAGGRTPTITLSAYAPPKSVHACCCRAFQSHIAKPMEPLGDAGAGRIVGCDASRERVNELDDCGQSGSASAVTELHVNASAWVACQLARDAGGLSRSEDRVEGPGAVSPPFRSVLNPPNDHLSGALARLQQRDPYCGQARRDAAAPMWSPNPTTDTSPGTARSLSRSARSTPIAASSSDVNSVVYRAPCNRRLRAAM